MGIIQKWRDNAQHKIDLDEARDKKRGFASKLDKAEEDYKKAHKKWSDLSFKK